MTAKLKWHRTTPQKPSGSGNTDAPVINTEEKPGYNNLLHWLDNARLDDRKWLLRLLHSTLNQTTLSDFDPIIAADIHDLKNKPALSQQAACQLHILINQLAKLERISLTTAGTPQVDFHDLKNQPNLEHATGLKNEEVYQRLLDFLRLFIQQTAMHNGQNTVGQPVLRPQTQAQLDQVKQHLLKLGYEENWVEFVECNQACQHPLEALANCLMQLGSLFADLFLSSKTALEQQQEEEQRNQPHFITPSPSPGGSSKKHRKKGKPHGKKRSN